MFGSKTRASAVLLFHNVNEIIYKTANIVPKMKLFSIIKFSESACCTLKGGKCNFYFANQLPLKTDTFAPWI